MSGYSDWGLGFLEAVFDPADLKNAGMLMGGGAAAFTLGPWALSLLKSDDPTSFLSKYGVWIKTGVAAAGGYALYKYGKNGGAWYKDLSFAAGAVLLGLAGATIVKKILKAADVSLANNVLALGDVGADEQALLEALNAIEDEPLRGLDDYAPLPLADGLGFEVPESAYAGLGAYGPQELVADAYPDYPVAGIDADVAPLDADLTEGYDGIDADMVEIDEQNPQGFLYLQQ